MPESNPFRATVDTSIYRQPEQKNALEQLGVLANMQNVMQQGELQRQALERLGAEKAGGAAFLQAVDPNTGLVNPNKLGAILKAHPEVAYAAPQMLERQQQLQGGQTQNETGATDLALKRQNHVGSALAGMASDPTLTLEKANGFVDQQVAAGVIPQKRGDAIKGEMAGLDGRGLRRYVLGHYNTMMGVQNAAPRVIGTNPQGAPIVGTTGQATAKAVTEGGIVPELAPGQGAAQAVDLEGSAKRGQALHEFADQSPQRKATLDNMLGTLNDFNSGKGAKSEADLRSMLGRFGLDPNAKLTAGTEEFSKMANQIAAGQAGQLGTTDQQQRTVMGANPSTEFSKMGNQRVIAILKGNEDAIVAKRNAFQRFKEANPQGTYDQFSTEFNREFDPRVFQYLNMDKAQREDFRKSLSKTQAEVFSRNAQKAIGYGWIGAPNAQ